MPTRPDRHVWALAAVLTSPVASVLAWQRAAGTGLSTTTVRVEPRTPGRVPWPAGDLTEAVAALRAGRIVGVRRAGDGRLRPRRRRGRAVAHMVDGADPLRCRWSRRGCRCAHEPVPSGRPGDHPQQDDADEFGEVHRLGHRVRLPDAVSSSVLEQRGAEQRTDERAAGRRRGAAGRTRTRDRLRAPRAEAPTWRAMWVGVPSSSPNTRGGRPGRGSRHRTTPARAATSRHVPVAGDGTATAPARRSRVRGRAAAAAPDESAARPVPSTPRSRHTRRGDRPGAADRPHAAHRRRRPRPAHGPSHSSVPPGSVPVVVPRCDGRPYRPFGSRQQTARHDLCLSGSAPWQDVTALMDHLTALLLDAQRGDRDALERFVVETQHDVIALCRYLGDADTADDLAQETYERAFSSLHRFRGNWPGQALAAHDRSAHVCRCRPPPHAPPPSEPAGRGRSRSISRPNRAAPASNSTRHCSRSTPTAERRSCSPRSTVCATRRRPSCSTSRSAPSARVSPAPASSSRQRSQRRSSPPTGNFLGPRDDRSDDGSRSRLVCALCSRCWSRSSPPWRRAEPTATLPTTSTSRRPARRAAPPRSPEDAASCHGANGEGGLAPAYVGLVGRTIELDGADPIVADEAYIIESIVDPSANASPGTCSRCRW